jgi:hypothetical protein
LSELPAVRVTVRDFRVWRCAVLALAGCAIGVLCAWAMQARGAQSDAVMWLALGLIAASLALAWSLWRARPVTLAFHPPTWFVAATARENDTPVAGAVKVSLDLGPWMLLRFIPVSETRGARRLWVPVQLSALKADAHALRCALYSSPRTAKDEAAKDAMVD